MNKLFHELLRHESQIYYLYTILSPKFILYGDFSKEKLIFIYFVISVINTIIIRQ